MIKERVLTAVYFQSQSNGLECTYVLQRGVAGEVLGIDFYIKRLLT